MNNVILNIFDVESEAFESFNELKNFKQTENTKIAQIALVQNNEAIRKLNPKICLIFTNDPPLSTLLFYSFLRNLAKILTKNKNCRFNFTRTGIESFFN